MAEPATNRLARAATPRAPRHYIVKMNGHDGEYLARSAGAAKYAAFKQLKDAGYKIEFRDFLRKVHVYCMGARHG